MLGALCPAADEATTDQEQAGQSRQNDIPLQGAVGTRITTLKDQCKHGGYLNFIDPSTGQPFKNQGQCIAYVNHHA